MPKQLAITEETPAIKAPPYESYGPLAVAYFKKYINDKIYGDQIIGIYQKDNKYYIGNNEVKIDNDNIIIDNNTIKGTRGLWELITRKYPENYTEDDLKKYTAILDYTNAFYYPSFHPSQKLRTHASNKWQNIVKNLFARRPSNIQAITTTDCTELLKRFHHLSTRNKAGNTGVNDEMKDIANKIHEQDAIEDNVYETMLKQSQN